MRLTIPVCRDGETNKSGSGEFKEGKMVFTLIAQLLLWIWFLGCTITWRFGKLLLVEGMGIKSAEFVMLCLYSIGLITYYLFQPAASRRPFTCALHRRPHALKNRGWQKLA